MTLECGNYPVRMRAAGVLIGLSVCLSVHGVSAMKSLLKALVRDRSVEFREY